MTAIGEGGVRLEKKRLKVRIIIETAEIENIERSDDPCYNPKTLKVEKLVNREHNLRKR